MKNLKRIATVMMLLFVTIFCVNGHCQEESSKTEMGDVAIKPIDEKVAQMEVQIANITEEFKTYKRIVGALGALVGSILGRLIFSKKRS